MAFPDSTLANPWSAGFVDAAAMYNNITAPLNLIVPRITDGGWITATLGNSWAAFGGTYSTPKYRLKNGVVYLKGAMTGGTSATTVFTVPAGYRPLDTIGVIGGSGATAVALCTMNASGVFIVHGYSSGGSNAAVNLGGVCWVAEQ
jgi:hypothetical protein